MYKSILVAFDISHEDRGLRILNKANELRDDGGAIKVIYVAEELPTYMDYAIPQDIIDRNIETVHQKLKKIVSDAKIEAQVLVRKGQPHHQILSAAEDMGADLVMVASHNPGFQDFFIGSTAGKVVRSAQCAVLVDRTHP